MYSTNNYQWIDICKAYAKKINATLLFVNDDSFGLETKNGELQHIYVDELIDILS